MIRWPFVSRARLEEAERNADRWREVAAHWEALVGEANAALQQERQYAKDLAERALQMRQAGFEPPPPPPPEPEPELPAEVEEAILGRAATPEVERHLRTFARQQLTVSSPDAVRERILLGDPVDESLLP
jgi:hypothetical protein